MHEEKTIIKDKTIDFVVEVASEVATLRLDDKSIYAAILYPVADYEEFEEKDVIEAAGKETHDLILTLKKLEEDYNKDDKNFFSRIDDITHDFSKRRHKKW